MQLENISTVLLFAKFFRHFRAKTRCLYPQFFHCCFVIYAEPMKILRIIYVSLRFKFFLKIYFKLDDYKHILLRKVESGFEVDQTCCIFQKFFIDYTCSNFAKLAPVSA